jgi:hypothetical protein
MRGWTISAVVLGALGLAGCNGQTGSAPAVTKAENSPAAANSMPETPAPQPIAVPVSAAPDQVVTVFLNALRSGDSPTTESLLTAKAREELAKHSMSVDVQSAPNATYQIRNAEVLADNLSGAHVSSVWTEKFDDGDETYEIVWVLRRQSEGWGAAGMAMQLIPEQQPHLNFENPEDMLKKKEEAMVALQPPPPRRPSSPRRATGCRLSQSTPARVVCRHSPNFAFHPESDVVPVLFPETPVKL